MAVQTEARYADLGTMREILMGQRAHRADLVVPASQLTMEGGALTLPMGTQALVNDGVLDLGRLVYRPTSGAVGDLAERFKIDTRYLRKLYTERPDLFDVNINGMAQGGAWQSTVVRGHGVEPMDALLPSAKADGRKLMVRLFTGDDGEPGVLRAVVSSRFLPVDSLDVLVAALQGVKAAGLDPDDMVIDGCDLTERGMYVRVRCPQITALAEGFVKDYKNPFGADGLTRAGHFGEDIRRALRAAEGEGQGFAPGQAPIVEAGFIIKNSDTGDGRFAVVPRIVARICDNGLTIEAEGYSRNHVGVDKAVGAVDYAADTMRAALDLVALQARDAVAKFVSPGYLQDKVDEIERDAGVELGAKPMDTITQILESSSVIPDALADEILGAFMAGGKNTAGGVANAITAVAQTVADPELADDLEGVALGAMRQAARIARS